MNDPVFGNVLVGWDGSSGAAASLRLAFRLARTQGSHVVALSVVPDYAHIEDLETRQAAEEEVRGALRSAFNTLLTASGSEPGDDVELQFAEANDAAAMLDSYAATHRLDLVVVGLHGREGMLHPKLGHIASHAVRSANCPVLVVPDADHPPTRSSHSRAVAGLFHPFHRHAAGASD